jgi:MFS family permease
MLETDANAAGSSGLAVPSKGGLYPVLVLAVLMVVYILNFIDRQILSILAEAIKQDLGISDADIGFLFGTAFAVFYSVMGIPLGRLADVWNRKKLIAVGLSIWSLMTTLSGFAHSFAALAFCRFGVGAGEASASPASYSILYDYFPPRIRTTILSLYSAGAFIGQGLGVFLGGFLLHRWAAAFPDPESAPFALSGWQVAFFVVGFPGLLLALIVLLLREPRRGQGDGIVTAEHPHPVQEASLTLVGMLPIGAAWALKRHEAGRGAHLSNLAGGLLIAAFAGLMIQATGNIVQWIAVGFGMYTVLSWAQLLAIRDRVSFGLIFHCRTFLWTVVGASATNFMIQSIGFWSISYYQRQFGLNTEEIGKVIGTAAATAGLVGVVAGGLLSDLLRRWTAAGKLIVLLISLMMSMAASLLLLTARQVEIAYVGSFALLLFSSMGLGPSVSTLNDLVLPRVRATATAFGFMSTYLIAGAIGPYAIGVGSDMLAASGRAAGSALRESMLFSLVIPTIGIAMVIAAIRSVGRDEASLASRARAFGEPI